MIERVVEPELMDEAEQARAYDEADFAEPNATFVERWNERVRPHLRGGAVVLDLGCGPADIPLRIVAQDPRVRIDAVDGAEAMLERARQRLDRDPPGADRVRLVHALLPAEDFPEEGYDAILSNSLLHHLHDPMVLWRTITQWGKPGAPVLVVDLKRPDAEAELDHLVATYSAGEPEVLRRDFRNSLHAAFTPDEIRAQLTRADLDGLTVEVGSDRHVVIYGRLAP